MQFGFDDYFFFVTEQLKVPRPIEALLLAL